MRLIYILLLSLVLNGLVAQDVRETVIFEEFSNTSLTKVIRTLKNKYKIKFAYDDALISGLAISGSYNNVSITDFLEEILPGKGIDYQVLNGKFILIPKIIEPDSAVPTLYNFTLSGSVRDRLTGETLPNALVRVAGSSRGTITNKDGRFLLPNVPSDTSTIEITYLGYNVSSTKLTPKDNTSAMNVEMRERTTRIPGVTVESIPSETIKIGEDVGQLSINPRSLMNVPSFGELDIFRSLQLLPGISGTDETAGGLSIRGSDPSQNLVKFDGFTIYRLDHFFGVFSAINADAVKDIQVYKSGFSPKYGDRVGGVIDITGKSGSRIKPEFNVGMNMLSARFGIQAPLFGKKGSFILTGRRSFTDILQTELYKNLITRARENSSEVEELTFGDESDNIIPDFHFSDINAKFSYQSTEDELLSVTYYRGNDNLKTDSERLFQDSPNNFSIQDMLQERAKWGNEGFGFSWSKQWNRQYYSRVTLGRSNFFEDYSYNYQFDLNDNGRNEQFDYTVLRDNNIEDTQFAFDNEVFVNQNHRIDFGLNMSKIVIDYNIKVNDDVNPIEKDDGRIYGIYVNEKFTPNEKLILEAGLRYTVTGLTFTNFISPRMSMRYQGTPELGVKLSLGRYQQLVHQVVQDDPFTNNQTFWALADDLGLPPLASTNFAGGFNYKKNGWNLDVEYFSKSVQGLFQFNVSHVLRGNGTVPEPELTFTGGLGNSNGVDILLQKDTRNYSGWLAYTYLQSTNRFGAINRGQTLPSLQDQRHEIKFVNMLDFKRFNISATWIYGSGKPYLQPQINFIRDAQGRIQEFEIDNTRKTVQRLPVYNRIDLSMAYKFGGPKFGGDLGISILNLMGRRNVRGRQLDIGVLEGARGQRTIDESIFRDLVLLDFTPSLFLNIKF